MKGRGVNLMTLINNVEGERADTKQCILGFQLHEAQKQQSRSGVLEGRMALVFGRRGRVVVGSSRGGIWRL